jgi:hypothetical protein
VKFIYIFVRSSLNYITGNTVKQLAQYIDTIPSGGALSQLQRLVNVSFTLPVTQVSQVEAVKQVAHS